MHQYTIITTVDITCTGVRTKTNDNEWNIKRNQQRNYDSLIQTISLRAQPMHIRITTEFVNDIRLYFGEALPESGKVWILTFNVEHSQPFGYDNKIFELDIHNVPVITGLDETFSAFPPIFQSYGMLKNICIISGEPKINIFA